MGPKTALKGTEVISDTFELPEQPFFSCEEDNFSIADGAVMRTDLRFANLEALLRLDVGEGNVFEQRPRSASREGSIVSVECDGDETVELDFDELAARKTTPEGEFVYKAGLDEANAGRGWLRMR